MINCECVYADIPEALGLMVRTSNNNYKMTLVRGGAPNEDKVWADGLPRLVRAGRIFAPTRAAASHSLA